MFRRTTERADGREIELLRALVKLGNQLQSSLELPAVVTTIARAMSETFGYREATVLLLDREHDEFHAHATAGRHPEIDAQVLDTVIPGHVLRDLLQARFQIGHSFFFDHREYTWEPDVERYFPRPDLGFRAAGEFHSKDALFVPVNDRNDDLVAVLDLFDPADHRQPTLETIKPLEEFATHAATAIANALRFEELERAAHELTATLSLRHYLLDLSAVLLGTLDQTKVFEQIADTLKTLVEYDTMDVRLIDEQAGELVCIFARDTNAEEILEFHTPLGMGVTGWVIAHDQAQLVNDMAHDPRVLQVPGTPVREAQASIVVPLNVSGKVNGVLTIDRLGGQQFDERELETTQLFANLAAIAIQNARTYKEMELQAISDGLTGIYNYRHFRDALSSTTSRAERYDESFCLLMMDLDHFKVVNDTVGHQQGDEVLRAVAGALRACSRESDYLARYGGEEFVMILPRTGLIEARTIAGRVCAAVREIDPGVPGLQVSMSIGVASYPDSSRDADGVLGAADAALLRAKASGRDRVCLYADEVLAHTLLDGHMVALGRRFAAHIGLSEDETVALVTVLAVHELGADQSVDLSAILGSRQPAQQRLAYEALLYGNERWDGAGYPEGLRGERIPRVARAFAVCRSYLAAGSAGHAAAQTGRADNEQSLLAEDRSAAATSAAGGTSDTAAAAATTVAAGLAHVRAKAAHELDPRLVQRLAAMLRAEAAEADGEPVRTQAGWADSPYGSALVN
ncbi:MAG: diguanylate cyclase [Thermoleophilia bacterium]